MRGVLCGLGALEDVPTSPNADDATSAKPFRGLGQSLALIVGEIRPVPESGPLMVAGQPQIMADLIGVDRFAGVVAQVRIVRIDELGAVCPRFFPCGLGESVDLCRGVELS